MRKQTIVSILAIIGSKRKNQKIYNLISLIVLEN